jgi:N-acetylmuramoyl-L-alanine amidase
MISAVRTEYRSPNFDSRAEGIPLRYIVLHYTGMPTRDEALQRLCDPAAKVSAHYLIDEDGTLFHLVDDQKRAWHAGVSSWNGIKDMNSASIGIELVNPGHAHGYRHFPDPQIAALITQLKELVARHGLDPRASLLAHADIAPTRKEDPGEFFPWHALHKEGFGRWPLTAESDYAPIRENEEKELLQKLGYECSNSNVYDPATRAAILAFQRRYEPDNMTGTPERETIARMRALLRQGS